MTANAISGDRDEVLGAGMNDYIAKPIDVRSMFDTLALWTTRAGSETAPAVPIVGES